MKSLAAITRERSAAKRNSKLSPKEVSLLVRLIRDEGYTYSAAGRRLGVSPRSAKWRWLKYQVANVENVVARMMLQSMRAKPRRQQEGR